MVAEGDGFSLDSIFVEKYADEVILQIFRENIGIRSEYSIEDVRRASIKALRNGCDEKYVGHILELAQLVEEESLRESRFSSIGALEQERYREISLSLLNASLQSKHENNRQKLRHCFEANCHYINMDFVEVQFFAISQQLNSSNSEMARYWTIGLNYLSDFLIDTELGNRRVNLEMADKNNVLLLIFYQRNDLFLEACEAFLKRSLILKKKTWENRSDNIEESIKCLDACLGTIDGYSLSGERIDQINAEACVSIGELYLHREKGVKEENIEIAITLFLGVLPSLERNKEWRNWAALQNYLGLAYRDRISGIKTENWLRSEHYFSQAINVFEKHNSIIELAFLQANLGNLYLDKWRGENLKDLTVLQKAIEFLNLALSNFPYEASENRSQLLSEIGDAYRLSYLNGEIDDFTNSVNSLSMALECCSKDISPRLWAGINQSLGHLFLEKSTGDRCDQYENAIRFLTNCLQVHTPKNERLTWIESCNLLGLAYANRVSGNPKENIEKAVSLYKAALQAIEDADDPSLSIRIKHNLGIAYSEGKTSRKKSDSAEDVKFSEYHIGENPYLDKLLQVSEAPEIGGDLETAIIMLREVRSSHYASGYAYGWGLASINLAKFLFKRKHGTRGEDITEAYSLLQDSLRVFTPSFMPHLFFQAHYFLGRVCLAGSTLQQDFENKQEDIQSAISHFKEGLKADSENKFSDLHLDSLKFLGYSYLRYAELYQEYTEDRVAQESLSDLACSCFESAIDFLETTRNDVAFTQGEKNRISEDGQNFYELIIDTCIAMNRPIKAFEYAERSRIQDFIEDILDMDIRRITSVPSADSIGALKQKIEDVKAELSHGRSPNRKASQNKLQAYRNELAQLREKEVGEAHSFNYSDFREHLDRETAVIELFFTNNQFFIFIITAHSTEPTILTSQQLDSEDELQGTPFSHWEIGLPLNRWQKLRACMTRYVSEYNTNGQQSCGSYLAGLLEELSRILSVRWLISQIPEQCNKLTFISHKDLHLIPIHALPILDRFGEPTQSRLTDRFSGGIKYLPSCHFLQIIKTRQLNPLDTALFAVDNPFDDFLFSEVDYIKEYFKEKEILKQDAATKSAVMTTSLESCSCLHFSCHAEFVPDDPTQSVIKLAQKQKLSLAEIFGLNLEKCRLVVLAACETGIVDFGNRTDSYTGFPAAFLFSGAPSVISSLWAVDQVSTAFLMMKFYENLSEHEKLEGHEISQSLIQAQQWLAHLTGEDVKACLELAFPNKPKTVSNYYNFICKDIQDNGNHPYSDPYYWAGFICTGL